MRTFKNQLVAFAVASSLTVICSPMANAQWYGYNPYNGAALWLSSARSLFYPFSRYRGYGYGYGASSLAYLAYPLVYSATYLTSLGLQREYTYGAYSDSGPYGTLRTRSRPLVTSSYVADQSVSAQRLPAPAQQLYGTYGTAPVSGAGSLPYVTGAYPPAVNAAYTTAEQHLPANPAISAPLAQGFIDSVNRKYEGNISKALFDPEMRHYAKSIGVVNDDDVFNADLSDDRVQLIKQVLSDPREDSVTKVSALRMLLKH